MSDTSEGFQDPYLRSDLIGWFSVLNQSPRFKNKVKPRGRQCSVSVYLSVHSVSSYGRPSPENKQENREKGVRKTLNRGGHAQTSASRRGACPSAQRGRSRAAAGAPRTPGGLSCACADRLQGLPAPGNMAAPVAAAGQALLRAGAERLLPGGIRALLRPQLECGTPAPQRDFSLSHNRVRAGFGLRDP